MGFQVKFLHIFVWGGFFLLLFSCQTSKPVPHTITSKQGVFSENSIDRLGVEKVQSQKRVQAFRLELEWLKIRKLIVEAEVRANEALQNEIALESEV